MTLPWIITMTAFGVMAGPWIRTTVFLHSVPYGEPLQRTCPACSRAALPPRFAWRVPMSVLGRCCSCRERIGPSLLSVELAGGIALGTAATRTSTPWMAMALAWFFLVGIALAGIDLAVHRLPHPLTAAAFVGSAALLMISALTAHDPWRAARALAGAAVLAAAYLAVSIIRPEGLGLGDAALATSTGLILTWFGWHFLLQGTSLAFASCLLYIAIAKVVNNAKTARLVVPFGPFMLLGALASIVIWTWCRFL